MQEIITFAATVILISASGVMSPGPLFASNVFHGLREGLSGGLKVSLGHTIVELPLVLLIGVSAVSLEVFPQFQVTISILGGIALFVFAGLQMRTIYNHKDMTDKAITASPVLTGIILTGLNPFFLVWWFTIGMKLISDSLNLWQTSGILILFLLHIWMDFVWLGAIAWLSSKSKKLLSSRNYKILVIVLSAILVYFGTTFMLDGLSQPQSIMSISLSQLSLNR